MCNPAPLPEYSRGDAAIQQEYEARKKSAVARFDASVGPGPRAEEFRSRLDEWIDALR